MRRSLTRYELQPWPKGYRRFHKQGACHRNATMLAHNHPELVLVKGYAMEPGIGMWVGHWWCVDAESRVVDPTWKNQGLAYVGVEVVDRIAVAKEIVAGGHWELGVEAIPAGELVSALYRAREK